MTVLGPSHQARLIDIEIKEGADHTQLSGDSVWACYDKEIRRGVAAFGK
jgi:hypothetical protein